MKIHSEKDLEKIRQDYSQKVYYPEAVKVNIGMASCGIAAGAKASYDQAIQNIPAGNGIRISQTGCIGFCEEEPLVEILGSARPRVIYKNITEDKILEAIQDYTEDNFNKKWRQGTVPK